MPVDHEMFDKVNISQWLWYFYNFIEDQKEEFDVRRDLVEYHASFIEPEAVRKIRESREESVEIPYEEFVDGIEYFFGRKINISKDKKNKIESHSIDPAAAARMSDLYKRDIKKTPVRVLDSGHWLNIDLE